MMDIEELKRLHAAATPGEWVSGIKNIGVWTGKVGEGYNGIAQCYPDGYASDKWSADSKAIIAIHNAFPALLAKLEAAQRLRDAVAGRADCHLHSDVMLAIVQFDKEQQ